MPVQTLAEAAIVARLDLSKVEREAAIGGRRAGENVGDGLVRGVDGKLRSSRGQFVRTGDQVGGPIADGAGRSFTSRILKPFQSGGKSAANHFSKGFADNSGAFQRTIANIAARVTLASGVIAAAAPGVIQFTAALAPAGGILVGLVPAALAAAAASVTLKVALGGVGAAIKAGLTGTAKQYEKALADLVPAQAAVVRQIVGMKGQINALRQSVAQRFFQPLIDDIGPLGTTLLPAVSAGMSGLAARLGKVSESVLRAGRSAPVVQAVKDVFDATGGAVGRVTGRIQPLIEAVARLVSSSVPILRGMAGDVDGLAGRFTKWANEAAKTGQIVTIFNRARVVIGQVLQILGNLGAIGRAVFGGLVGDSGTFLARVVTLTSQIRAFVQSAKGAAFLQNLFQTLGVLGETMRRTLAGVLPEIGRALQIAAPAAAAFAAAAGRLIVAFGPLLPAFASSAATVARVLVPAMQSLAGWLERNQGIVRALAPVLVGYMIAARAVAAVTAAVTAATRAWSVVVGVAKAAQAGWTAVSWLASAPVHAHTAAMRLSMTTAGTWIGVKRIEAVAWLSSTAATIRDTAVKVANRVATLAHAAATAAWSVATKAAAFAGTAFTAVMKGVRIVMATAFGPISIVIAVIAALAAGLIYAYKHSETFRRIVDASFAWVKKVIKAVGDWFTGTLVPSWKRAIDQIVTAFQFMRGIINTVIGWVRNFIRGQILAVTAVLTGLKTFVTVTLPNAFRTFQTGVRTVIDWVRSFIASRVAAVLSVFGNLRTFVTQTLPNAFRSGVAAIGRFWDALRAKARDPIAFVVKHVINPFIGGFNAISGVFHGPKLDTIKGFASGGQLDREGGRIPGPPSSRDNRLAWLKDAAGRAVGNVAVATGEFVVNARDTMKALPLLRWINDGMRGGPTEVARRIGRPLVDTPGDGSEGWAFAEGGLVGWVKSVASSAKNSLTNVWESVADPNTFKKPFEAALRGIPGGGAIKDFLLGAAKKILGMATGWISNAGGLGSTFSAIGKGAGALARAMVFLRAQGGKPYVWASAGPRGYDCSGIVSAVYNILHGKSPYSHTFSTGSLPDGYFREGAAGPLMAGWSHPGQSPAGPGTGHMAGQLLGYPFESRGSRGVVLGGAARRISQFAHVGAARANGGLLELQKVAKVTQADFGKVTLAPGQNLVYNGLGRPERLEEPAGGNGGLGRMHPADIDALASAIGDVLSRALLGTVPATRVAGRQVGRRPR